MGCAQAHYDGIVAFSQTDFTEDLKKSLSLYWSCMVMTIRLFPMRMRACSQQNCFRTVR